MTRENPAVILPHIIANPLNIYIVIIYLVFSESGDLYKLSFITDAIVESLGVLFGIWILISSILGFLSYWFKKYEVTQYGLRLLSGIVYTSDNIIPFEHMREVILRERMLFRVKRVTSAIINTSSTMYHFSPFIGGALATSVVLDLNAVTAAKLQSELNHRLSRNPLETQDERVHVSSPNENIDTYQEFGCDLTEKSIIVRKGFLFKKTIEIPYANISNIELTQGFSKLFSKHVDMRIYGKNIVDKRHFETLQGVLVSKLPKSVAEALRIELLNKL